jgi:hypothetical protein
MDEHPRVTPEQFVDAATAAQFLSTTARRVLELARSGRIPAHPLDPHSQKKQWRFRLSELSVAIAPRNEHESSQVPGRVVAEEPRRVHRR